jgi:uncharacterized membrane protein YebE (DUF533 family)
VTVQEMSGHPVTGATVDTLSAGAWLIGTIDTVESSPSQAIVLALIGLAILAYRAYRSERRRQDEEDARAQESTWRGRYYAEHSATVDLRKALEQSISDYATLAARLEAVEAASINERCPWVADSKARCAGETSPLGPQPGETFPA